MYINYNSRGSDEDDVDDINMEDVNSPNSDRMLIAESESVFRRISKQGFRMGKSLRDERKLQSDFNDGFSSGVALGEACGSYLAAYTHAMIAMKKDEESSSSVHSIIENNRRTSSNTIDQQLHRMRLIFIEEIPARKIPTQQVLSQLDLAHHFLVERFQVQLSEKKAAVDDAINSLYKAKVEIEDK